MSRAFDVLAPKAGIRTMFTGPKACRSLDVIFVLESSCCLSDAKWRFKLKWSSLQGVDVKWEGLEPADAGQTWCVWENSINGQVCAGGSYRRLSCDTKRFVRQINSSNELILHQLCHIQGNGKTHEAQFARLCSLKSMDVTATITAKVSRNSRKCDLWGVWLSATPDANQSCRYLSILL